MQGFEADILCRSVPGISAVPHEDNLRYFDVMIHGPTQSPYEGEIRPRKPQIPHILTSTQAVSSSWSYSSQMITL
jgi:ubiquitin-conjugating enzyme E2 N